MKAQPFPDFFSAALEIEWRRLAASASGGPRVERAPSAGRLSRSELDGAARSLLALQRGLTGSRSLIGSPYMSADELLAAYLLYYWPASFCQVGHALDTVMAREGGFQPQRVLDIGSGPGPASAACALRGAESILALDPSSPALGILDRMLDAADWEGDYSGRQWKAGQPIPEEGPFDLIVLSHSINELFHDKNERMRLRADLLSELVGRLAPGGILLALEPALLATSRDLISLRDEALARGLSVLAPCIFKGPCPALAAGPAQTCHDQAAWEPPYFVSEIAQRAGLARPDLKMAWFAIGAARGSSDGSGASPLQSGLLRVVSEPMLNKAGRTRYMVCGAAGRFTLSAKISELEPACESFSRLRRGDLISVEGAQLREAGSLGLCAASRLSILSEQALS